MAGENHHAVECEDRWLVLAELDDWLETPMVLLAFVWLVLAVVEVIWGSTRLLEIFGTGIWIIFLLEFFMRLALAPRKLSFVAANWLTVLALAAPAFRLLRVFRTLRFARSLRLVRVVGTANRSMRALRATMKRRGVGYVLTLSTLVILIGAAGMLAFEPASEVQGGFTGYADALWWTAMLMTSIGSEFWPETAEGRLLCFLLSLYGFGVFGYITAAFASYFVGRDAAESDAEIVGARDLAALHREIERLRAAVER